jgi:uncharacterized protein (DUF2141 family)
MKKQLVRVVVGAVALWMAGSVPADLTVEVQGVKSADGEVAVGLFDQTQAATFPKQFSVGQRLAASKDGVVVFVFKDLKPGAYAVSSYHDENDNKKLDRGMFGIPKEAYAFSQDARGEGGPPQFRDAQFTVADNGTKIVVKLR